MYQQLDRLSITELSLLSANINLNLGFLRDSYLSISDHVHAVVLHVSVLILSFASAATWRLRPTWLLQQLVCGVHDLPEKLQAARNPTAMVLWRQVRNSTTWCRCRRERHWIPYQLAIAVYKCMRWMVFGWRLSGDVCYCRQVTRPADTGILPGWGRELGRPTRRFAVTRSVICNSLPNYHTVAPRTVLLSPLTFSKRLETHRLD